jgi:hypothetical protein
MTRAELVAYIRQQTLIEEYELDDTAIEAYLTQGLLEIASLFEWPWTEAFDAISLVDGTPAYDVPADFMQLKNLSYVGQGRTQLAPTTQLDVVEEFGEIVGDSALPDRYYYAGGQIHFVPTPDAAQDVTIFYYATPDLQDFDADSDEPPFHGAYHLVLAHYGIARVWEYMEFFDRAGKAEGEYYSMIDRMANFYSIQVPRGPLVVGGGPNYAVRRRKPYVGWPE